MAVCFAKDPSLLLLAMVNGFLFSNANLAILFFKPDFRAGHPG